jgi:hypothetical protein
MSSNLNRLLINIQERANSIDKINKHSDFRYKSIESLVLAYGKPFSHQIKSPFKGEPKSCFENCYQALYEFPELSYCEGFAIDDDLDFAVSHAWLVNNSLEVIDPTWIGERFQGSSYFGVVFTDDFVLEIVDKTLCYGILDSDYMIDHLLKREGFPTHALKASVTNNS